MSRQGRISSLRRSSAHEVAAYLRFTVDPTGAGTDDSGGTGQTTRRWIELELLVLVVVGLVVLAVVAHW